MSLNLKCASGVKSSGTSHGTVKGRIEVIYAEGVEKKATKRRAAASLRNA